MYELAKAITKQIYLCQAVGRWEAFRSRRPSVRCSREKSNTSDAVSQTENVCRLQTLFLNARENKSASRGATHASLLRIRSVAIFFEVIWQPVVEQAGVAGNLATQNLLPCLTEVGHLAHNLGNKRRAR